MKSRKRFYFYGLFIPLMLLILSSPAFGVFPYNPLPPYVSSNPLRDETGYKYTYCRTNNLTSDIDCTDPQNYETISIGSVLGYRWNTPFSQFGDPKWYKERGWTISTHGLFRSRPDPNNPHIGLDIAAPVGTPVYAVDAGSVNYDYQSGTPPLPQYRVNRGAGFYAVVIHIPGGLNTAYMHLEQFGYTILPPWPKPVDPGQRTQIATSGATGNATVMWNGSSYVPNPNAANLGGPHLHFGVFTQGRLRGPVDPLLYLPDVGSPIAKLRYIDVIDDSGQTIYSRQNGKLSDIINNNNIVYTYGPATVRVGGEFDDDLMVNAVTYALTYGDRWITQQRYTLEPRYATPVSKATNRFHYLPEWKGVFLTSNFSNRAVGASTLNINPEDIAEIPGYEINPAAVPDYTFSFGVSVPPAKPCDPANRDGTFYVELIVADSQDNKTFVPNFLIIKPRPTGAPPLDCSGGGSNGGGPGGDHPDDNYDYASISIANVEPITREKLLKLAVKKNKLAVLRSYLLKEEFENLDRQEKDYYASFPEKDAEEAIAGDLDQVLEITDPVLQEIYGKKQDIIDEWRAIEAREKEEYKQLPDVALLTNGFGHLFQMLLEKIGEPYAFLPISFSSEVIQNRPVVIIPSGGLHGLKNSDFFKQPFGARQR